jgi:hypothetical protein
VKRKPILVLISSHEIHPGIAADLFVYDVRHISRRFYNIPQIFENIDLVCGGEQPNVIMATLPKHWVVPFIQTVRQKWALPGVTITRPVMVGDKWLGRYEKRYVDKAGILHHSAWVPQGSERDKKQQAVNREQQESYRTLLSRLEDL